MPKVGLPGTAMSDQLGVHRSQVVPVTKDLKMWNFDVSYIIAEHGVEQTVQKMALM